ncbi:MAG TPA: hypothetical protein VLE94_20580 [Burkholderiaceae bacterium]|nr:hypothetical protein [Burkholderiaceae bacterium]HSC00272.1 hypothetical protein [Burkholderiaceae bacterium]
MVEQNPAFAALFVDSQLSIEQGPVVRDARRDEIDREQLLAHLHV